MIITCDACNHQVIAPGIPLGKESKASITQARCGSCGTIYQIEVRELRATDLTPEELKRYRNKTS